MYEEKNAKKAAPIAIATVSPDAADRRRVPGYLTSIRAPSLKSMRESSSQRNPRASRWCSFACSTPPNVRRAATRASSRPRPLATHSSSSSCRCEAISRDNSASGRAKPEEGQQPKAEATNVRHVKRRGPRKGRTRSTWTSSGVVLVPAVARRVQASDPRRGR